MKIKLRKSRSALGFVLLSCCCLFISGCFTVYHAPWVSALSEARYEDAEKILKDEQQSVGLAKLKHFSLCETYNFQKKYTEFFQCSDQLIEIFQYDGPLVPDYMVRNYSWDQEAAIYSWRAEALMDLGRFPEALVEAEKGYVISKSRSVDITSGGQVLAAGAYTMSLAFNGNKEKAFQVGEELEKIECRGFGQLVTAAEGQKHLYLAKLNMHYGNYAQSLKHAETAYRSIHNIGMAMTKLLMSGSNDWNLWEEIPSYYISAKTLYETGNISSAKSQYDDLLKIKQIQASGAIYWNILFDRGKIELAGGNTSAAIDFFTRAIEVIESQRSTIGSEASKIGFVGDKQQVYHALIKTMFESGRYAEAFSYTERAKARALVDMLASKKEFKGGNREDTATTMAMLQKMDAAEITSLVLKPGSTPEQEPKTRSISLQKKEIQEADPELASLVTVNPPEITELQQMLSPDETLIEYYGEGEELYAFVVTRNTIKGFSLKSKDIRSQVISFRQRIVNPPDTARGIVVKVKENSNRIVEQLDHDSNSLYRELIAPLAEEIKTENLTIVPHGILHYLPFNALATQNGYLIDKYNIRLLPSASVMKFLRNPQKERQGSLLAFGNPDLNNKDYDLPGAEEESKIITEMVTDAKLYTRGLATESKAKELTGQYRYIHFALHGTFDAERPLTSGLLLSPDSRNDGILTVAELYDLNMPADLVTLSACETALGKISNGDDVVGFTRGFLYAGASSIVSSLWQVDDRATSMLMQDFYGNLQKTDKRNALRQAQLHIKDTYNSHPFYWAAFQLTGAVQ
ncbi:MAG: CHAT domain-containing protein [Proteobacteria bacterium]|nr:CHAT domain-containing protein [Pseudomonadota bacterium]MBU1715535.1 CHAT domain-containing protein [Pseudomonadota bacterium]